MRSSRNTAQTVFRSKIGDETVRPLFGVNLPSRSLVHPQRIHLNWYPAVVVVKELAITE